MVFRTSELIIHMLALTHFKFIFLFLTFEKIYLQYAQYIITHFLHKSRPHLWRKIKICLEVKQYLHARVDLVDGPTA